MSPYFMRRRAKVQKANIVQDPKFQLPFGGPWLTGQNAVGWYWDSVRKLAVNDGTETGTQFFYQYLTNDAGAATLVIEIVQHPSGLANTDVMYLSGIANYQLIPATPGIQRIPVQIVQNAAIFFFPEGRNNNTLRTAIKSVQLFPQ